MKLLDDIAARLAHILHPEKPREFFQDIHFPTDLPPEEISARLDEAAKASPQFKNWRTSDVDLLKLTHPEDPDGAASMENRKALAKELGEPGFTGTAAQNIWLHDRILKALEQRGIKLP